MEVTIQQSTFERLQRHAKPLVDTTDTVISRALDALERLTREHNGVVHAAASERMIDPRMLPSLTHTKVLDASIAGERIARANWNLMLDEMLCRAIRHVGSLEKLRTICPVNMVKGRKEGEGYSYLREIDISVQGQDANGACRAIVTAAQGLGISLDVGFMWRLKEGAVHPGERARIRFGGSKSREGQAA